MNATELKRWDDLCKHLQEQGYTGYAQGEINVSHNPQTGQVGVAVLNVVDQWGKTHGVNITPFVGLDEIKPPPPMPLPQGDAPLDCK